MNNRETSEMTGAEDDAAAARIVVDAIKDLRRRDQSIGADISARLIAGFDAHMRARRNRVSLQLFADAFGWRALARPMAATGLLVMIGAGGLFAGIATPEDDTSIYADLSDALDQSFANDEELTP